MKKYVILFFLSPFIMGVTSYQGEARKNRYADLGAGSSALIVPNQGASQEGKNAEKTCQEQAAQIFKKSGENSTLEKAPIVVGGEVGILQLPYEPWVSKCVELSSNPSGKY